MDTERKYLGLLLVGFRNGSNSRPAPRTTLRVGPSPAHTSATVLQPCPPLSRVPLSLWREQGRSPRFAAPTPAENSSEAPRTKPTLQGSPSVPSPPSVAAPPASSSASQARDALSDLAAVRRAAEEQHARLKEAGRLPAETEISQRAQKLLEDYRRSVDSSPPPPPPPPPPVHSETPVSANTYRPRDAVPPSQPIPYNADSLQAQPRTPSLSQATGPYEQLGDGPIKFTADFGAVLQQAQGQGIGVILGVGRGEFALQLLKTWPASAGVYLCDPYIHIWHGYKDPDNHSDRDHQLIFEDLRNRLVPYEGKYVLIRDFSYSFADTYRSEPNQPPPTFIYIDANHAYAAVKQDLKQWWPVLATGGLIAGSTFLDDDQHSIGVATAVREFATTVQADLYLTQDSLPSWYMVKG